MNWPDNPSNEYAPGAVAVGADRAGARSLTGRLTLVALLRGFMTKFSSWDSPLVIGRPRFNLFSQASEQRKAPRGG